MKRQHGHLDLEFLKYFALAAGLIFSGLGGYFLVIFVRW